MSEHQPDETTFGRCCLCRRVLTEREYLLGLGRCRDCARKCESEVSFDTVYENVEKKTDNAKRPQSVRGPNTVHRPAGGRSEVQHSGSEIAHGDRF